LVPLFDARHDRRTAPLQFALAGMNAHISHDLAIGVVQRRMVMIALGECDRRAAGSVPREPRR
jgi:Family of unknown function (DUF5995)